MENKEKKEKLSRPVSLLLLIPALLFGLIAMALSYVGFGLIPILPAMVGILFGGISLLLFRRSYRTFTIIVLSLSLLASLVSVFRGVIIEKKVSIDETFDSTVVKTQQGIDSDLMDAFGDDTFGSGEMKDTVIMPVK